MKKQNQKKKIQQLNERKKGKRQSKKEEEAIELEKESEETK